MYRKVPKFRTPELFAVIYVKFKQRGQTLKFFFVKMVQMEKQTLKTLIRLLEAVLSGSALFAQTYLSKNLGSLRYILKLAHSLKNS